jgi:hypothetical protein
MVLIFFVRLLRRCTVIAECLSVHMSVCHVCDLCTNQKFLHLANKHAARMKNPRAEILKSEMLRWL